MAGVARIHPHAVLPLCCIVHLHLTVTAALPDPGRPSRYACWASCSCCACCRWVKDIEGSMSEGQKVISIYLCLRSLQPIPPHRNARTERAGPIFPLSLFNIYSCTRGLAAPGVYQGTFLVSRLTAAPPPPPNYPII